MVKRVKYDGEWYIQDGCGEWVLEREYLRGASWESRHPVLAAVAGVAILVSVVAALACL